MSGLYERYHDRFQPLDEISNLARTRTGKVRLRDARFPDCQTPSDPGAHGGPDRIRRPALQALVQRSVDSADDLVGIRNAVEREVEVSSRRGVEVDLPTRNRRSSVNLNHSALECSSAKPLPGRATRSPPPPPRRPRSRPPIRDTPARCPPSSFTSPPHRRSASSATLRRSANARAGRHPGDSAPHAAPDVETPAACRRARCGARRRGGRTADWFRTIDRLTNGGTRKPPLPAMAKALTSHKDVFRLAIRPKPLTPFAYVAFRVIALADR